ncbi:MAG: hypothetical protein K2P42_18395, partial [Lachnospiraceae bacterium]|nr:hypothetical protein [Lachnospiraceae bacterium]
DPSQQAPPCFYVLCSDHVHNNLLSITSGAPNGQADQPRHFVLRVGKIFWLPCKQIYKFNVLQVYALFKGIFAGATGFIFWFHVIKEQKMISYKSNR